MKSKKNRSSSFLGLALSGAKNQKTTIAALQYFAKEDKTFLLDVYDGIGSSGKQTGDSVLIELLDELSEDLAKICVTVPLTTPSCLNCHAKNCVTKKTCLNPDTQYVKSILKKAQRSSTLSIKEYTAYTQRPIEVYLRHFVLSKLPKKLQFEIDETFGGNKAPLCARMDYIKKFLDKKKTIETLPKLSTSILCKQMGITPKVFETHRNLELGSQSREIIIDKLANEHSVFIYEKDRKKITRNLDCFDAFISAFTGILLVQKKTEPIPKGFPKKSGWIEFPINR